MKKGFTLVELLAVVILMGVLLAFTYPKIIDIKEKKEQEIDSAKVKLINNAALEYMNNNLNEYSQNIGEKHCISLETLDRENLIPIEIDDVLKKYNYVKIRIGINNQHSYALVNAESVEKCKGTENS